MLSEYPCDWTSISTQCGFKHPRVHLSICGEYIGTIKDSIGSPSYICNISCFSFCRAGNTQGNWFSQTRFKALIWYSTETCLSLAAKNQISDCLVCVGMFGFKMRQSYLLSLNNIRYTGYRKLESLPRGCAPPQTSWAAVCIHAFSHSLIIYYKERLLGIC